MEWERFRALMLFLAADFMLWLHLTFSVQGWGRALSGALSHLYQLMVGAILVSFLLYIRSYTLLFRAVLSLGLRLGAIWRLPYCLLLALTLSRFGEGVLPLRAVLPPVIVLHALAVALLWRQGEFWCKQEMGLRPSVFIDPHDPWGGLDYNV